MTTFVGNGGTVLAGSNAIGGLRSYSVEETTETIDDSVIGSTYQTHKGGLKSWSGSADVYFDDGDTAQQALTVGASLVLSFEMEGTASGAHKLSGTVTVASRSISAAFDNMVEASITFTGNGALTEGTV